MSGRETAWRMLGAEFNAAAVSEKGEGDRSATYLLTPLGARANRVMMVGTIQPPEHAGRDPAQPFLRSRLADPTGTVTVTAGGFQPRALRALDSIHAPTLALVVGKTHLYLGREQAAYPSVRAESLRPIPEPNYRYHLLEAVRQTLDRVDLVEHLRTDRAGPAATHWPTSWEESGREALARYPGIDLSRFRDAARAALASVEAEPNTRPTAVQGKGVARVSRTPPVPAAPGREAGPHPEEAAFLEVVDELADGALDGYADLSEVYHALGRRGIPEPRAEAILNRLEESGAIEEPVVGKLRRG